MSYNTATSDQQKQVQQFVLNMRGVCVEWFRIFNQINQLNLNWNNNILGILGSPQGILIPDGTNLAGAVELTDTQVTNIFGSILQAMMTAYFTGGNQATMVPAVGLNTAQS